jgi:hypothetical protein
MALQGSGQITLTEIAGEFNDSAPHEMSEFYAAATCISPEPGTVAAAA